MFDLEEHFTPGTVGLYLDDVRQPRPNYYFNWVIVRSYQEFVNYIQQQGVPQFISFDHDLADEHVLHYLGHNHDHAVGPYRITPEDYQNFQEKTGMDAAKWLVEWCADNNLLLPLFTVHSANPAGAQNILSFLNNFRKFQGQEPNGYRTAW